MVRFTPKQQNSMVFVGITRIAVLVKIAVLAEIAILVKIMINLTLRPKGVHVLDVVLRCLEVDQHKQYELLHEIKGSGK